MPPEAGRISRRGLLATGLAAAACPADAYTGGFERMARALEERAGARLGFWGSGLRFGLDEPAGIVSAPSEGFAEAAHENGMQGALPAELAATASAVTLDKIQGGLGNIDVAGGLFQ